MKTKQTTGILLFLCLCGFLVSCGPRKEQELSNGNWIISKTSDGEKRFGIESSNGNILVEPTYESIVPIEDEPSILECANSSIFGSCELITQDGRRLFEELGKYTSRYYKQETVSEQIGIRKAPTNKISIKEKLSEKKAEITKRENSILKEKTTKSVENVL